MKLPYRASVLLRSKLKKPRDILRAAANTGSLQLWRLGARLGLAASDKIRMHPPAGVYQTADEWFAVKGRSQGGKLTEVGGASIVSNPLPRTVYADVRLQLSNDRQMSYPPTFVAEVPDGRVWGDGMVVSADNMLISDLSIDRMPRRKGVPTIISDWDIRPLRTLKGRALVIATEGAELYYHWLFQALPRFELVRQCGLAIDSFDHVIVNKLRHQFQRDSLRALDIPEHKIVETGAQAHYRADMLVVPSIALHDGNFPDWMTGMLRRMFLKTVSHASGRRIYIARGNAGYRRVRNEDDVVRLLERHGFEVIRTEKYPIAEQAAIMASASAVVAPHGGGLSNLVFCSPGAKVIELFAPELVAGYYWKLSNRMGLDYHYLIGKGPPGRERADYVQSWDAGADITVDLDELKSTLVLAGI